MSSRLTRREFLITGAAASATVLGRPLLKLDSAYANPAPLVRRNVGNLSANDPVIISYRKAIVAMRNRKYTDLPGTRELSWVYQAAIHGTTLTLPISMGGLGISPLPSWNTCTHGDTPFFWPWHRMYLYWFERIVRQLSCDPNWALPYWDWSCPSQRRLPPMFRDPVNSVELYDSSRNAAINAGTGTLAPSSVDPTYTGNYKNGLASLVFSTASSFSQGMQSTPHGDVHTSVGGNMANVPTAALDPIFFLHHANMDRLWDNWLGQGGGRSDPLTNSAWTSKTYTFFDENGHAVTRTPCDVLRPADQLGYVYEQECPQVSQDCNNPSGGFIEVTTFSQTLSLQPFTLGSDNVTVPLGVLPPELRQAVQNGDHANVQLNNVEALEPPGVTWEVYFGLPPGAEPVPESPYFVGTLSLFGAGIRSQYHHARETAKFAFTINGALAAGLVGLNPSLTFVPTGILVDGRRTRPQVNSPVTVGSVSLTVTKEVPMDSDR